MSDFVALIEWRDCFWALDGRGELYVAVPTDPRDTDRLTISWRRVEQVEAR